MSAFLWFASVVAIFLFGTGVTSFLLARLRSGVFGLLVFLGGAGLTTWAVHTCMTKGFEALS